MGNLTQAYLTFFPNGSKKNQPVIYTKGRQSCAKARGRKEIKVLKQNKFSLSDWGSLSFQETFKILISSKNLRIIFLKNETLEKLRFSCLFCLVNFLCHLSSSFTFSIPNRKDLEREKKKKKRENVKQPQRNLDFFLCKYFVQIVRINKVFCCMWRPSKLEHFKRSFVYCDYFTSPKVTPLRLTKHFWHFKIFQTALQWNHSNITKQTMILTVWVSAFRCHSASVWKRGV